MSQNQNPFEDVLGLSPVQAAEAILKMSSKEFWRRFHLMGQNNFRKLLQGGALDLDVAAALVAKASRGEVFNLRSFAKIVRQGMIGHARRSRREKVKRDARKGKKAVKKSAKKKASAKSPKKKATKKAAKRTLSPEHRAALAEGRRKWMARKADEKAAASKAAKKSSQKKASAESPKKAAKQPSQALSSDEGEWKATKKKASRRAGGRRTLH